MSNEPLTSRRDVLRRASCGFGHLALLGMVGPSARASIPSSERYSNPLAPKPTHYTPKAKRVIFLFMHGGVSQVDTFDPKPKLTEMDGQPLPFAVPLSFAEPKEMGKLLRSPWKFRKHGESGLEVSELFPRVASCVDEISMIRSMTHDRVSHGPALQELHTGSGVFHRPSVGSWVLYGLGTQNQNLPGFITICPTSLDAGAHSFGSAFLPATYQGTKLGETTSRGHPDDARRARFKDLRPADPSSTLQRLELDLAQTINRKQLQRVGDDPDLEARIESLELAFRMQAEAPEVVDLSGESKEMLAFYGVGEGPTDNFARQCLLARRLAERGVRFIQCTHSYKWDQHGGLKTLHERNAREVDKPIAALLKDLKRRGMLDETLVFWGTEFGRTPVAQGKDGRDHNPYGFTVWMAGGGIKGGTTYGATDEFGYFAVENKLQIHDLHATILHLLGLDHTRLTFPYGGRELRLTDVGGRILHEIIS